MKLLLTFLKVTWLITNKMSRNHNNVPVTINVVGTDQVIERGIQTFKIVLNLKLPISKLTSHR